MIRATIQFKRSILLISLAAGLLAAAPAAGQSTYTWSDPTTSGAATWSTPGDWSLTSGAGNATNYPGGVSGTFDTANFGSNLNPTGTLTITDPTNLYLNTINFNQTTTAFGYVLQTGTINLGGTTPTISVATAGVTETITAVIAGTSLTKTGAGALVLTANPTYTGATTISGGTLQFGAGTTISSVASNTSGLAVSSGATLGFNVTNGSTSVTIPWSKISGSGSLNFSGSNSSANSNSYTSTLATMTSSFTGSILVNQFRIIDNVAGGSFGGTTSITVAPGSQITIGLAGAINIPITIAGNGWWDNATTSAGALRLGNNGPVWGGTITLAANARISATGSLPVSITGTILGAGYQLELGNGGTDTLTLSPSASNVFAAVEISNSNGTNVNTIVAGNGNAFPTSTPAALIMNGSTLKLNGSSFPFANLQGAAGAINNGSASSSSIITIGSDNSSTTYGGTLADGGTATLGLTKTGTGTLALTGANTFTGPTTVNGGTLQITTAGVPASASITVNDGGALSVVGITPTSSVLNVSSLSLGSTNGAALNLSFSGFSSTAPVNVTNSLVLTGTTVLNISNTVAPTIGEFPLISYSGGPITSGFSVRLR